MEVPARPSITYVQNLRGFYQRQSQLTGGQMLDRTISDPTKRAFAASAGSEAPAEPAAEASAGFRSFCCYQSSG